LSHRSLYIKHLAHQMGYLLKQGRFREAYNYQWARLFSIEEGLALGLYIYRRFPSLLPYPRRIELEVTTKCRLKWPKCEHTYWNEQQEDMSFAQVKRIVEMFPHLRAISLTGIGHGFENPEYFDMLQYLRERGLFIQFFDPLLLVDDPHIIGDLVLLEPNWIWVSMDGATKETYERHIVGSNFDKVLKNAKMLIEAREAEGSVFPELHFQFIVTKNNILEMPQFVDLVHSIVQETQVLTEIQFIKLIPFAENQSLLPPYGFPEEILRQTQENVDEYGDIRLKIIHGGVKYPVQGCFAFSVPFITVKGEVWPCCTLTQGNVRHLLRGHALGNVFKDDFRTIWNSQEFIQLREDIACGIMPPLCKDFRECTMFEEVD
jgi:MoaA/NifB/PqqE/SkfB family radical SAM enzyme